MIWPSFVLYLALLLVFIELRIVGARVTLSLSRFVRSCAYSCI